MFDKKKADFTSKDSSYLDKGLYSFPLNSESLFYKLQSALKCIDFMVGSEYLLCNAESYKKRKAFTRLEKKVMETLASSSKKKVKFLLGSVAFFFKYTMRNIVRNTLHGICHCNSEIIVLSCWCSPTPSERKL